MQHRTNGTLKPKVRQTPANFGLFSDPIDPTSAPNLANGPANPAPDINAQVLQLADEIEATGHPASTGFATGMRVAAKQAFVKPASVAFYQSKLQEFKAQSGTKDSNPNEYYSLDDVLMGDTKPVSDYRNILETGKPPDIAALIRAADNRYRELVREVNALGFKINEINSFGQPPAYIANATKLASHIAGSTMRLLNGLRTAGGNTQSQRVQDDIAGLRNILSPIPKD